MQLYENILILLLTSLIHFTNCKNLSRHLMFCAGNVDTVCESNLCFDEFDITQNTLRSGCADESICLSVGCFMVQKKFICCCSYTICNGNSEEIVKAWLKLWNNGIKPVTIATTNFDSSLLKPDNTFIKDIRTSVSVKSDISENVMQSMMPVTKMSSALTTTTSTIEMVNGYTIFGKSTMVSNEVNAKETSAIFPKNFKGTIHDGNDSTTLHAFISLKKSEIGRNLNSNNPKTQTSDHQNHKPTRKELEVFNKFVINNTASAIYLNRNNKGWKKKEEEEKMNRTSLTAYRTAIPAVLKQFRPRNLTATSENTMESWSQKWTTSIIPQFHQIDFTSFNTTANDDYLIKAENIDESSREEVVLNDNIATETLQNITAQSDGEELVEIKGLYPNAAEVVTDIKSLAKGLNDNVIDTKEELENQEVVQDIIEQRITHGFTTVKVTKTTKENSEFEARDVGEGTTTDVSDDSSSRDGNDNDSSMIISEGKDDNDDGKDNEKKRKDNDKHELRVIDSFVDLIADENWTSFNGINIKYSVQNASKESTSPSIERKRSLLRVERDGITTRPISRDIKGKSSWKGVIPWWLVMLIGLLTASLIGGFIYELIKKRRSEKAKLESERVQEMMPLRKIAGSAE